MSVLAWSVFLGVSSRGKTFCECPLVDFLSMSVRSRSFLSMSGSVRSRSFLARSVFLGVSCSECQCLDVNIGR